MMQWEELFTLNLDLLFEGGVWLDQISWVEAQIKLLEGLPVTRPASHQQYSPQEDTQLTSLTSSTVHPLCIRSQWWGTNIATSGTDVYHGRSVREDIGGGWEAALS